MPRDHSASVNPLSWLWNAGRLFPLLGVAFAAVTSPSAFVWGADEQLSAPKTLRAARGMSEAEVMQVLSPALRYYAFWNTGEERFAHDALSSDFIDLNLPEGRPQGPDGPIAASRSFRQAVPDLKVSAEEVWVMGDQVIGRLRFAGHFTGTFGELKGKGQPVAFDAVEIYTMRNGLIVTNWHLEDNLALLRQLGAAPAQ